MRFNGNLSPMRWRAVGGRNPENSLGRLQKAKKEEKDTVGDGTPPGRGTEYLVHT
jgi:hypothetical protein